MPQFKQVDVFSAKKFRGNPVAVFFDADGVSTEDMALMAAWTNLSEATFVQKPTDGKSDYKVRIFSLDTELPFAGHPTIGTCHALLESGLIKPKDGKILQQCGAGIVELTIDHGTISFTLPYAHRKEISEAQIEKVLQSIGAPLTKTRAAIYDVGPHWLVIKLDSAKTVLGLNPDSAVVASVSNELGATGFQVLGPREEENCYETRTFASAIGVKEDPVCGSGSGATGAYLRDEESFSGECHLTQGTILKREGKIVVTVGEDISVGGAAVTTLCGEY